MIETIDTPDITAPGLARLGFDPAALAQFMRAGLGPQGVMTFSMYEVVEHSTRYLTPADAADMASYLMAGAPAPSAVIMTNAAGDLAAGRTSYIAVCAGCHGVYGEGVPHVAPAMRTDTALRLPSAHNLVLVLTQGLPEHSFPNGEHMQAMPGFGYLLTSLQITAIADYLRATWGGDAPGATDGR